MGNFVHIVFFFFQNYFFGFHLIKVSDNFVTFQIYRRTKTFFSRIMSDVRQLFGPLIVVSFSLIVRGNYKKNLKT